MVKFYVGNSEYVDVEEALERLLSLLLVRVQRKLDTNEELEFQQLRRALMRERGVSERLPRLVTENSESGGVWSVLREHSDQWEPRREYVREQMRSVFDFVRSLERDELLSSSGWTGIESKRERLKAARELLPLAEATVAALIAELERPQGNGGPPLEDRAEAIENLRKLHRVIGELLAKIEGEAAPSLSQRLLDEATGYLTRFAHSVRNDPMPYLVSAGLFSVFAALGGGPVGGFLAGVASSIKKNTGGTST
jgi:hypothetical protein